MLTNSKDNLRKLTDFTDLESKRVILRCDFNVPMSEGVITDDGRIRASIPTIKYLLEQGSSVIICSHLGRPEGEVVEKYSLQPVAKRLGELLDQEVFFASDTVGSEAKGVAKALLPGGVALLENLRFNSAETSKDAQERLGFAQKLADLGDYFVSDGFGVVHRKQASVYELAKLLPSAAGLLVSKEVEVLSRLTNSDSKPYTVVLGGSKVSDKLGVIGALLPKVDNLVIGGGMLFTFLAAKGYRVGKSLLEEDQIETVRNYLAKAEELGVSIHLPTDILMASGFAADAEYVPANVDALEETKFGSAGIGLDIGPETSLAFAKVIESSGLCFWNGPMGVFEFEAFSQGTRAVAEALTKVSGLSVVGGGDSAAAVRALGFDESAFGHISTGGGASLEYLEGKSLPGLEVLN
ncbi:MAG: phosphoglycerate kinase [Actinomycetota bacterium]